jgi:hypothetical protein
MKRGLSALLLCLLAHSALAADPQLWALDGTWRYPQAGSSRVIGTLRSANFNSTADQAIPIPAQIIKWAPTAIWVTNCSVSMTLAVGGIYPAVSKGGIALVAATQAYSAATASTILVPSVLAVTTTAYTINTVYLSLTTAQGAAATCDVYVIGMDLS